VRRVTVGAPRIPVLRRCRCGERMGNRPRAAGLYSTLARRSCRCGERMGNRPRRPRTRSGRPLPPPRSVGGTRAGSGRRARGRSARSRHGGKVPMICEDGRVAVAGGGRAALSTQLLRHEPGIERLLVSRRRDRGSLRACTRRRYGHARSRPVAHAASGGGVPTVATARTPRLDQSRFIVASSAEPCVVANGSLGYPSRCEAARRATPLRAHAPARQSTD
jgi:hypothetical protein